MLKELYPFSTLDGKVIPLDILRPLGALRVSFSAVGTALQDLGIDTPILVLRASQNCFLRFGAVATIPTSTILPNTLYLPATEVLVVAPNSSYFSIVSDGVDGVLDIQLIERWRGLAEDISYKG